MKIGIGIGADIGPAAPFIPTNISGCVLWLRADMGITQSSGVSVWADQSGSGDANKNTVAPSGHRPTLNASDAAYNSQATLSFAAGNFMQSGTWATPLSQPSTIILVGNDNGAGGNEFYIDGLDGTHRQAIFWLGGSGADGMGDATNNITKIRSSTSPNAFMSVFSGASSAFYVNALTAVATGNAGIQSLTGITLGVDETLNAVLAGKIVEVIAYNSALTSTQRSQLFIYLSKRYGITIGA